MIRVALSLRGGAVLAALVVSGCSSPTASCEGTSAVSGQWSYRATRESPVQGTISGSLVIESRNCVDVQGVMDVVEVLSTGEARRMAGTISGTVIDSTLVRFEAVLGGGSREHFARIDGDSLAGTWVETTGGPSGSGPFTGHRQGAR
ncbi:MAG TPA: hypothetical protein VIK50_17585 [Gemmatimonadaceae bacterium]